MKTFALIGAAGYIAPRHMHAIKQTGNELVAAMDKHDSVGILDHYFPEADFFTEFERFERHLEKLRRSGKKIDYLTVCTPNYLHDAHIRFGLRLGADVICEKPLVLTPGNIDALAEVENECGNKVYTIMQLRHHPSILQLKSEVSQSKKDRFNVDLRYFTPRGHWYHTSWKGDLSKSGGIATNIGIHFFDLLTWIFGKVINSTVSHHTSDFASGILNLEKADVNWMLSIRQEDLPPEARQAGQHAYRSLVIDGRSYEFNSLAEDLHVSSYRSILSGNGFDLEQCRASICLVHSIRETTK